MFSVYCWSGESIGESKLLKADNQSPQPVKHEEFDAKTPVIQETKLTTRRVASPESGKKAETPKTPLGGSSSMSKRRITPISGLNPYMGNWVIKARVTRLGNLRTFRYWPLRVCIIGVFAVIKEINVFNFFYCHCGYFCQTHTHTRKFSGRGGREGSVFDCDFTDEAGSAIQASFFNEEAQRFYPVVKENNLYYVSRGNLKPANYKYAVVKNDYQLMISRETEIEEVPEHETPSKELFREKLELIQITDLPR